jgi:hypothetical protein
MKIKILILVFIFVFKPSFGQDKILTKDKQLLNVKIVNETQKGFNYVTNKSDTVSILTINKNRILKIEYEDGSVNMMGYQNPRKMRPLGFSIGYGFSKMETYSHHLSTYSEQEVTLTTLSIDYFIIPQIDLESTLGIFSGQMSYFSAGFNLHINSDKSKLGLTPFAGLSGGAIKLNYHTSGTGLLQMQTGLNYLTRFGLNISVAENFLLNTENHLSPFTAIRIGWKFKV